MVDPQVYAPDYQHLSDQALFVQWERRASLGHPNQVKALARELDKRNIPYTGFFAGRRYLRSSLKRVLWTLGGGAAIAALAMRGLSPAASLHLAGFLALMALLVLLLLGLVHISGKVPSYHGLSASNASAPVFSALVQLLLGGLFWLLTFSAVAAAS